MSTTEWLLYQKYEGHKQYEILKVEIRYIIQLGFHVNHAYNYMNTIELSLYLFLFFS